MSMSHWMNWRKRPFCGRSARHTGPIWIAQQELQTLERRRLDATEAIPLVRGQDRRRSLVAQLDLGRQQVLHAARRRRVELHHGTEARAATNGRGIASAVW